MFVFICSHEQAVVKKMMNGNETVLLRRDGPVAENIKPEFYFMLLVFKRLVTMGQDSIN